MVRDPLADFEDLADARAPGSRMPTQAAVRARESSTPVRVPDSDWDSRPRMYSVPGRGEVEFFDIGALAVALNRRPATIRTWEATGVIPKATFVKGQGNGKRRLYTRAQVEGMRRIAAEEGVLEHDYQSIRTTNFTRRVVELFVQLQGES